MSWDILIQDLPAEAKSVDEIPDDFAPQPLGSRPALIAKIQAAVPTCDFSDPAWGQVVTADYVVEFNMGNAEVVESIMLHIRGGDAAVGLVADILEHLALRAIDVQQGKFFDPAVAGESLAAWRRYRDQVIGPVEA